MIEPLLALPAHLRSRLASALSASLLGPPYTAAAIRSALAGADADIDALHDALATLHARGITGPAIALALDVAARTSTAGASRPDLVWSGPTAPGVHTRSTRQVYDELIATATRSIWISTYAYDDGQHAFKSLADRMAAVDALQVRILLNITRRPDDGRPGDEVAARFAERFWSHDWPGEKRPPSTTTRDRSSPTGRRACCTPRRSSSTTGRHS